MAQAVYPWRSLGGKSRNFQNVETGEILSRRQYDKLYGSLARRGVTSYEQGAKLTPPEIRKRRPARGRKSTLHREETPNLARVQPPKRPKRSKRFLIYLDELIEKLEQVKRNSRVYTLTIVAGVVETENGERLTNAVYWPPTLRKEIEAGEIAAGIAFQFLKIIPEFTFNAANFGAKNYPELSKLGSARGEVIINAIGVIFHLTWPHFDER